MQHREIGYPQPRNKNHHNLQDWLHSFMNTRYSPSQILPPLPLFFPIIHIISSTSRHHETRSLDQSLEFSLPRESLNTLYEILIAIPVPRNQLPNDRYCPKAPSFVDGVQQRIANFRELKTCEHPAGFQYAICLLKCIWDGGKISDAERDGVEINARTFNCREVFRVSFKVAYAVSIRVCCLRHSFSAFSQHLGVDIADDDAGILIIVDEGSMIEKAQCNITGAARNIEDALSFGSSGTTREVRGSGGGGWRGLPNARIDRTHEAVFPETVNIERHQVVHGIVVLSHGGEHRADCDQIVSI